MRTELGSPVETLSEILPHLGEIPLERGVLDCGSPHLPVFLDSFFGRCPSRAFSPAHLSIVSSAVCDRITRQYLGAMPAPIPWPCDCGTAVALDLSRGGQNRFTLWITANSQRPTREHRKGTIMTSILLHHWAVYGYLAWVLMVTTAIVWQSRAQGKAEATSRVWQTRPVLVPTPNLRPVVLSLGSRQAKKAIRKARAERSCERPPLEGRKSLSWECFAYSI
jgi:hypothetical protein